MINHYALPPTTAGGTRHYYFAKQLMQRGHEVLIIASNYDHFSQTHRQAVCDSIDNSHEVPFFWIPSPAYRGNTLARFWNMLVFSWRLRRTKRLLSQSPPDVIIGSSPHLFAALGAAHLARHFKCPFILEIRDLWPDSLVELGRFTERHPLIKVMKKIELHLYRHAARIISLLPMATQYLTALGVNEKDVCYLPNAIDTDLVPEFTHEKQTKFTFMYAGAHGLANDLGTLLAAAKILEQRGLTDKIRICLIGEGPDKPRLQGLVLQENIQSVEFYAPLPKKEIYAFLNKADAFMMLLKKSPVFRWGISPNKLFDYLLMSRPVVFGVETPFNPVKTHDAGVSVSPSDPIALANAMEHLIHLPAEKLQQMGAKGRQFVSEHHHIARLAERLENLLRETV